ncbi:uncharacterized protein LOC126377434 [Pectinophora gossypiella]|uniref:uncharacterized protein LOC126377434 n=1 Tax=Pectinophora gossypiella TaxID=13191 RepID=UPI00214E00FB|nr:uncharacterized protein LOC126377434 [Pectinophora gossypiella]
MERFLIFIAMTSSLLAGVLPEVAPGASLTPAPTPAGGPATGAAGDSADSADEPPEGYYAFVESPNATPPRVRPPPYRQVPTECAEAGAARAHVTAHNLCGDLNRGVIPRNPMRQNPTGEPYPFELIRNQTLRFLSRALPVLRADDTLPRVQHVPAAPPPPSPPRGAHAQYAHELDAQAYLHDNRLEERSRRSLEAASELRAEHRAAGGGGGAEPDATAPASRDSRKFCDGGGVFCMLYRAINGDAGAASAGVERREDPGPHAAHAHARYEGPPTPCPARVEYATPVFARNYQGVWRYVVQIPYEGYFTQTVEVTRCMQSRCHYLEGGCLSSPRWVSLLVAELHYPQVPYTPQQPRHTLYVFYGAGAASTDKPPHCDGHDDMGCFQVRLYYDWFLVPGSCKCWRPDYFARYVRRRHASPDL